MSGKVFWRLTFLLAVMALGFVFSACDDSSEDPQDLLEAMEVEDAIEADVEDEPDESDLGRELKDPGEITLSPYDVNWTEPVATEECDICRPCTTPSDCEDGELCARVDGAQVCTALCSDGVCPGNAQCWNITDSNDQTTSLCLNPAADEEICAASWACGPGEDPVDPDAGEYPPIDCPTSGECYFCEPDIEAVTFCESATENFQCEVWRLTNNERIAAGYPGLEYNGVLARAAQGHAADMRVCSYFAHECLDGRTPFDRMAAAGYAGSTMGENIAAGQQTPQEVVEGWMESKGHRENILNPDFTEIGVGYEYSEDSLGPRWVQNFGSP